MENEVARILIDDSQIDTRLSALAEEIAAVYADDTTGLTLLPILSGSIIFLADLIRKLPIKMKIALVGVSSYPGKSTNPREARTILNINADLRDRHVLIVDDILDTGGTLRRVREMVNEYQPASVRTAVLLRKPARAPVDVTADFIGFDIEDEFVIGYGLDYDDHYRNFPHIGVLRDDLIQ